MSRLLKKFLTEHKGKMFRYYLKDDGECEGKLVDFDEKYLAIADFRGNITLVKISNVVKFKEFIDRT